MLAFQRGHGNLAIRLLSQSSLSSVAFRLPLHLSAEAGGCHGHTTQSRTTTKFGVASARFLAVRLGALPGVAGDPAGLRESTRSHRKQKLGQPQRGRARKTAREIRRWHKYSSLTTDKRSLVIGVAESHSKYTISRTQAKATMINSNSSRTSFIGGNLG
jgi:hypothetical protein